MPTLKIQKADGTFEFLQLAGEEFADIGNQVIDVKSQLAQTDQQVEFSKRKINNVWVDVKEDFGAKMDGVSDDSVPLQNAINYLNERGGGVVYIPPEGILRASNVRLYSFITIQGLKHTINGWNLTGKGSVIRSFGEGAIFYTPDNETVDHIAFEGLTFIGLQQLGDIDTQGIILGRTNDVTIEKCDFFLFKNEAIWHKNGGTLRLNIVKAFGMSRQGNSFPERSGTVRIAGHDCMINMCEFGANHSTDQVNLWNSALKYEGTAGIISNSIFEGGDIGALITGANNQFTNCRSDINYGHGWWLTRENPTFTPPWRNIFDNCWSHRNSRYGSNLFDNFRIESGQSIAGTQMTNIKSSNANGDSWAHRYGIYDGSGNARVTNFNDFGAVTSWFDGISGYSGLDETSMDKQVHTPSSGTTTPDVKGRSVIRFNNSTSTNITDFLNGVNGQVIYVQSINTNTTIKNSSQLRTSTATDKTMSQWVVYCFRRILGSWFEVN